MRRNLSFSSTRPEHPIGVKIARFDEVNLYSLQPMFRLTRQVRFAVNHAPDDQLASSPTNSFGGFPTLTGLGHYFEVDVTVRGQTDRDTDYLLNIKEIDSAVRRMIVPLLAQAINAGQFGGGGIVILEIFRALRAQWAKVMLHSVKLRLSPQLSLACTDWELPMVRLSQKFEFSASHRLHNPRFTDEQNRTAFGKCNNPHGHGHNYEVQVTLKGEPDDDGIIVDIPKFEKVVTETVIQRFDHRNLNTETPEFRDVNPTVENIARVIYRLLKPQLTTERTLLHGITVWETPKTWCEYSE
jgi:6-pyruvoyltetrahydropterin/6-carboxytetrahydropterin synthase